MQPAASELRRPSNWVHCISQQLSRREILTQTDDATLWLAIAHRGMSRIFFGDSTGSFSPAFAFDTVADATGLAVGDFNKDSKLDLAVSSSQGDSVSILTNACAGPAGQIATVSAASYTPNVPVAAGSIVSGFGLNLSLVNTNASTIPLPISLAGTTVTVTDANGDERFAALFAAFAGHDQLSDSTGNRRRSGPGESH